MNIQLTNYKTEVVSLLIQVQIFIQEWLLENIRPDDIVVNISLTKKMSNMRASGNDDKTSIAPAVHFSLEESMEYIGPDEYLEVTPKSLRIRKILLNETDRKRAAK